MRSKIYQLESQLVLDIDIEQLSVREGEMLALVGPKRRGQVDAAAPAQLSRVAVVRQHQLLRARQWAAFVPLDVRRQVTTVFQRPVLQRGSVRDNVAYGLYLRGQPRNGSVDEMLETVGLTDLTRHGAQTLSGGEMQRVALARALVVQPRVLLLDEPTANLDPYNVGLIEDIVRKTNAEQGTTVILVTHNVFQARRLAHRTGLMLGGKLIELADTPAFFASPVDQRTGAFVRGEMVC